MITACIRPSRDIRPNRDMRPNRNMRPKDIPNGCAYTPGHKELKRHDKSPDSWGSLMATGTGDYGLDRKGHDQILTQVTKFIGEAEFS
jgi:hypothetical protein